MIDFSQSLSAARSQRGITRDELADRVSLDPSHIYRLESGDRHPSRETVLALADALEVDSGTLNLWLVSAGYAPLDLAVSFRHMVRVRGTSLRSGRNARPALSLDTATWARQLEAIGLKETMVARLVEAMASSSLATQRHVSTALSAALSRALTVLDCPVRTAVIPAAGDQHRLLAPHLMQRLLIAAIHEAAACGIANAVLVLAPDTVDALYTTIRDAISIGPGPLIRLAYCVQGTPDGLGDAVLQSEGSLGKEAFAVLLPDDSVQHRVSRRADHMLRQMIGVGQQYQDAHLVAVTRLPRNKMGHCGVVQVRMGAGHPGASQVLRLAEKPSPGHPIYEARDVLGIVGRYVLQPSVFTALRGLKEQVRRPLELTDALEQVCRDGGTVLACGLNGSRSDVGELVSRTGRMIEKLEEYNLKRGEVYGKGN